MMLSVLDTPKCIFCESDLSADTKPEHILLNALGGKKTTRCVVCSRHNGSFGGTIDKEVAAQVAIVRNMLHLTSGEGKDPPMLRRVNAGRDTINVGSDGSIRPLTKPLSFVPSDVGSLRVSVSASSFEEIAKLIPHIAAKLKLREERDLQQLTAAPAKVVSRRPGLVHHSVAFGGPLAIRSFVKSALVLWATLVGNDEVKSAAYKATRDLVLIGDDEFVRERVKLDSRPLRQVDEMRRRFGNFFNVIYVRSNEAGRVFGHFTLYNMMSWHFILAERGGTPSLKIGLISNPSVPTTWSDTIAEGDRPRPRRYLAG